MRPLSCLKRWIVQCLVIIVGLGTPLARAQSPTSRPAAWQADLQVLSDNLKSLHPNLFVRTSRADFDGAVARLNGNIPTLPEARIVAEFARIAALGGDAHTNLFLFPQAVGFRRFPLQLQWLSDGLFVTGVTSESRRALGRRVVGIGGTDVSQAYAAIEPFVSHENESWLRQISQDYLVTAEVLWSAGVLPATETGLFTFEEPGGTTFDLTLQSMPGTGPINWIVGPEPGRQALYQRDRNLNYWLHYFSESKTLYVKYNQCADAPNFPFTTFAQQVLRLVEEQGVDRFVVDLRNNTGGNSALIAPLFQGLGALALQGKVRLDTPFRVIIGRETFSSAMLNAIEFKVVGGATLIGEPTGGKPSGYGEVRTFTLPNSTLRISYSTRLIPTPGFDGLAVNPDIAVLASSTDYFNGIDPALNTAMEGQSTRTDRVPIHLHPSGRSTWQTSNEGATPTAGFGELLAAPGNSIPMGLAVFAFRQGGVTVSEASVPAAAPVRSGRLFAESGPSVRTGIALANPNDREATVTFSFTDADGREFGAGQMTLAPRTQVARFLNESPFLSGSLPGGSFSFTASDAVAAIGLRGLTNERGDFLMSTLPVADTDAAPTPGSRFLAHFADGGGWNTEVLLVNTTNQSISGTVDFAPSGTVTIDGQTASTFSYSLGPRAARRLRTTGAESLVRSGYIRVTPAAGSPAPSASSLFAFRANGVTLSEATVAAVSGAASAVFPAEAVGAFSAGDPGSVMSGLALANPSDTLVRASLALAGTGGLPARSSVIVEIPARSQVALFLNQVRGWEVLTTPFHGTLTVTANAPIAATGLRARFNERGDFLVTATPGLEQLDRAYFPQIADSGGFTTQFILVDGGGGRQTTGFLRLVEQGGAALMLGVR